MSFRVILLMLCCAVAAWGEPTVVKVKDAVRVKGVNANPLVGYGLVVGLAGSGDSSPQGQRMAFNMFEQAGIHIEEQKLRTRNVAAVTVTASLPPFAQAGDTLDILVSSVGDARSLRGGTLMMTRLEAADGTTFAVAQGSVLSGDSSPGARAGSAVAAGRIPGGALVLRDMPAPTATAGRTTLVLKEPDYATASRLRDVVCGRAGAGSARVLGPATVEVTLPSGLTESDLMARIGDLDLETDMPARVVINERTGTIVMGGSVRIAPVAISHGMLKVRVAEGPVRQASLAGEPARQASLPGESRHGTLTVLGSGASLQDLVDALNDLGTTPTEMMQVLQALKQAGALEADLVVQ